MELKRGTLLQGGKYRIERSLGQGTFGITYLATARFTTEGNLGRMGVVAKVCIKEFYMRDLNSRSSDGSSEGGSTVSEFINYRQKFRKEAENLSRLDHPYIVRVYDVFDENDTTYYTMEYIDGENLDDYIGRHNPLPEEEAIGIVHAICQALMSMHERQMLHLDLKPKNIMRSREGNIYLIDFGLSKLFKSNGEPETSTTIGPGTPGYAPIEQANLIRTGTFPATLDIYALGATMYKLLTGSRPLDASAILNDGFPRAQLIRKNRSATLISIVEKCMSPIRKDRFQSIAEILHVLPQASTVSPLKSENTRDRMEETEISLLNKPDKKKLPAQNQRIILSNAKEAEQAVQDYLNDSSRKGSFWNDLKVTIIYVLIGVGILFTLISMAKGKEENKQDNQNQYYKYQYYTPSPIGINPKHESKD